LYVPTYSGAKQPKPKPKVAGFISKGEPKTLLEGTAANVPKD
jgi:hypothetical protein